MTEPGVGSDFPSLTTSARRDGDGWILNGEKCFIANGSVGSLFFVDARSNPDVNIKQGGTLFMVPKGTPKEVIDVLYAAATEAVNSADVRDKLKSVDTIPIALSSAASIEWLSSNRKRWSEVAARTGLKTE